MRRKRFIRLVSNMGQRRCPHEESNVKPSDLTLNCFTIEPQRLDDAYVARIQSDNYDKRHICEQNETDKTSSNLPSFLFENFFEVLCKLLKEWCATLTRSVRKIHSLSETGAFFFFFFLVFQVSRGKRKRRGLRS